MRLRIKQIGKPFKTVIIEQKKRDSELIQDIYKLGKRTHKFMIDFIADKSKTSVGNMRNSEPLTESIDYHEYAFTTGIGWGIGSIEKLDNESPHWRWIEFGGKHPLADKQYPDNFVPGEFQGDGIFIYAPYNGTGIVVKTQKIFKPMGFVEATKDFLDKEIKKIMDKYARG